MKIPDWKESYQDVLFERDQSEVATTIVSAQLVMRLALPERLSGCSGDDGAAP